MTDITRNTRNAIFDNRRMPNRITNLAFTIMATAMPLAKKANHKAK